MLQERLLRLLPRRKPHRHLPHVSCLCHDMPLLIYAGHATGIAPRPEPAAPAPSTPPPPPSPSRSPAPAAQQATSTAPPPPPPPAAAAAPSPPPTTAAAPESTANKIRFGQREERRVSGTI